MRRLAEETLVAEDPFSPSSFQTLIESFSACRSLGDNCGLIRLPDQEQNLRCHGQLRRDITLQRSCARRPDTFAKKLVSAPAAVIQEICNVYDLCTYASAMIARQNASKAAGRNS